MNAITGGAGSSRGVGNPGGAGNPRGAGSSREAEYSPLPHQTDQSRLSTRDKMCMGALVLLVFVVNEAYLGFELCVDDVPDPLLFRYRINTDEKGEIVDELVAHGYLTPKPTGDGFNPTMKLVDSLPKDKNLAESLSELGIDPDDLKSNTCKCTLLEAGLYVGTGHSIEACPPYRPTEAHDAPCALREQQQLLREQQQEPPRGTNTTRVLNYLGQLITGENRSSSTIKRNDTRFLDYTGLSITGANHSSSTK